MKPLPGDPMARHGRFIAALCDDLASREYLRTGKTPRADAAAARSRQMGVAGSDPIQEHELGARHPVDRTTILSCAISDDRRPGAPRRDGAAR